MTCSHGMSGLAGTQSFVELENNAATHVPGMQQALEHRAQRSHIVQQPLWGRAQQHAIRNAMGEFPLMDCKRELAVTLDTGQ